MTPPSIDEIRRLVDEAPAARLPALLDSLADDPRAGVQSLAAAAQARLNRARAERSRLSVLYRLETRLRREGCVIVAGIDEVGRGALAGPLTAAAVVLPPAPRIQGLDDSKKVLPGRREELAVQIRAVALGMAIAHVPAHEIDAIGITAAVKRAMQLAVAELDPAPDHVLVDGLPVGVTSSETSVVKGDSTVAAIAAASIVAKVARDALMRSIAAEYPEYHFDVNKGYGTGEHMQAITRSGLCVIHRRSFAPCGGTLPLF